MWSAGSSKAIMESNGIEHRSPWGRGTIEVIQRIVWRLEANEESVENLRTNLAEQGYSLDKIPYVIQYNKRDLPKVAPVDYLEFLLNHGTRRVPTFEAVAVGGAGVFETLNTVSRMVLMSGFAREDGTS